MTIPGIITIRKNALIALVSLLSFTSCEEAPVEFTRTERRMIDSLFQEKKPMIDREVDSLCKKWADQHLDQYKDSLMRKRWAEIELILQSND